MVDSLTVPTLRVGYTITTDALDTSYKKISVMEDWDRRSKRFPCLLLVMHTVHRTASRCYQVLVRDLGFLFLKVVLMH